jgi:hypothetical protein
MAFILFVESALLSLERVKRLDIIHNIIPAITVVMNGNIYFVILSVQFLEEAGITGADDALVGLDSGLGSISGIAMGGPSGVSAFWFVMAP